MEKSSKTFTISKYKVTIKSNRVNRAIPLFELLIKILTCSTLSDFGCRTSMGQWRRAVHRHKSRQIPRTGPQRTNVLRFGSGLQRAQPVDRIRHWICRLHKLPEDQRSGGRIGQSVGKVGHSGLRHLPGLPVQQQRRLPGGDQRKRLHLPVPAGIFRKRLPDDRRIVRLLPCFSIEMDIKPEDNRNRLLAYSSQNMNGNGDFILLLIRDQQIEFTVDTGSGKLSSQATNGRAYKKSLNLHTPLYLGGYDDTSISLHPSIYIKEGFKGCISSLKLNERPPTNLLKDATGASNVVQCHGAAHRTHEDSNSAYDDDLCGEQRCQNDGRCDHSDGTPVCQCTSDFG
ncbi:unnamed protein product, partial [Nesidiocoris tenuis]